KDAIKAKKMYKFPADELQLFLAKKDEGRGAWLTEEDVNNGVKDTDGLTPLDVAGAPLNLVDLSAEDVRFRVTKEDIIAKKTPVHVLVVVPEGAVGSASETSKIDQVVQEVHEIHAQTVLTKRKRYVHSKLNSTQGRELLEDLNIKVDLVRTVPYAAREETRIDAFKWESVIGEDGQSVVLTEEQQRERYRAYVERNIGAVLNEKQLCVIGVEKGQDVLSVQVRGRDIELSGRTDLLILSDIVKNNPFDVQYLPEVKLLIEVKRAVKPSSDFQALSELIALDLLVDDPVMALLTDLNEEWLFFWVAEKENASARICKARIRTPGEAFEVIKTLLTQSPTADAEIRLPCFQESVKRQKLSKLLPPIGEGGESGGVRESIERYYDIASMLGPDLDMARAVARQVTRSIPTLSYFS
ncbi:hypothetical protein PR003_g26343, partial [Phytophthora rubi]